LPGFALRPPPIAQAAWVPQVRGPRGQVFVRGVEIPLLGPGRAQTQGTKSQGQSLTASPHLQAAAPVWPRS
jgi:hypothetical protein